MSPDMAADPYAVLGLERDASDPEVRAAYRRLVQLHHPDHNGGSPESAARFAAVQSAYTAVLADRKARTAAAAPGGDSASPDLDARLAAMERELQQQRQAAARAAAAAGEAARAAAPTPPRRPTPEELGYFATDDTLGQIIADAEAELAERFAQAKRDATRSPLAKRLTDFFAGPGDD